MPGDLLTAHIVTDFDSVDEVRLLVQARRPARGRLCAPSRPPSLPIDDLLQ